MTLVVLRVLLAGVLLSVTSPARAQWVVYDPTNYTQAVSLYTQAVQQYQFLLQQARRLPTHAANRYRVAGPEWRTHEVALPMLGSLNTGSGVTAAYRDFVDPLDAIEDVLAKTPQALRSRLSGRAGGLAMADSVARLGLEQTGAIRAAGPTRMRSIQAMEDDSLAAGDEFHSQTALLNKINGAAVLGLRIAEQGTQFLAHTVEQLLLDNLRKRQAEAQLLNAHIYQRRYGDRYGAEMFDKTASRLDAWRQP